MHLCNTSIARGTNNRRRAWGTASAFAFPESFWHSFADLGFAKELAFLFVKFLIKIKKKNNKSELRRHWDLITIKIFVRPESNEDESQKDSTDTWYILYLVQLWTKPGRGYMIFDSHAMTIYCFEWFPNTGIAYYENAGELTANRCSWCA